MAVIEFWKEKINPITGFKTNILKLTKPSKAKKYTSCNVSSFDKNKYITRRDALELSGVKANDFKAFMKDQGIDDYCVVQQSTIYYVKEHFDYFLKKFERPKKSVEKIPIGFISSKEVLELTSWSSYVLWYNTKHFKIPILKIKIGNKLSNFYLKDAVVSIKDSRRNEFIESKMNICK